MFGKLARKSLISWNVMVVVFMNYSLSSEAIDLYSQMKTFMKKKFVKDALGVRDINFVTCSPIVYQVIFVIWMKNWGGIKLFIYMEKYDIICNWFNNFKEFNAMQWFGQMETFTFGYAVIQSKLLTMDAEGLLAKEPVQILERGMVKKGNQALTQVLIHGQLFFSEDAIGESLFDLQQRFSHFGP